MPKYQLSTGLRTVKETPEFDNDRDAWEYLRKVLMPANCYATLYKEVLFEVGLNNKESYLKAHNETYTLEKIDETKPYYRPVWVPVLTGLTHDEYNVTI